MMIVGHDQERSHADAVAAEVREHRIDDLAVFRRDVMDRNDQGIVFRAGSCDDRKKLRGGDRAHSCRIFGCAATANKRKKRPWMNDVLRRALSASEPPPHPLFPAIFNTFRNSSGVTGMTERRDRRT